MRCLFCGHAETKVTDKRDIKGKVRRRRECLNPRCKKRFTTYEQVEGIDLYVIKKDGRREKFERRKLEDGIEKALEKRPISKEDVEKMINEIEESLKKNTKGKEVNSSVIGELVMKKLKKLDGVAYVRFASVYRDFKDVNDFKREIKNLG
ncbi:MAG: transcriptional regulator NrdR [Nanoarchaeota archaeon]